MNSKPNHKNLIIILGILIAIGPLTIDVYLPAFVDIATDLQTKISQVQLTLTFYFIGIVLGQIFYGPIIDRYGKKPPLIFGLTLFVVTSLLCCFAKNIEQIIILRFFQAIGGCASVVISRAIVRDIFNSQQTAQVFSSLVLVMGLAPIIAPFIGNIILKNFDWRIIFLFLAIYGFICLIMSLIKVPETKGFNKDEKISDAFKKYLAILKDRNFIINSLCGSTMMACLMSYMTASPFLYLQYFKTSTTFYSSLFSINALGFVALAQINGILLKKYSIEKILDKLIYIPLFSGICLILVGFVEQQLILTTILIFILVSICGAINPNTSALALANQRKHSGSASALFGTIQFFSATIFSMLANYFHNNSATPICIIIGSCGILCFIIHKFYSKSGHHYHTKNSQETIN
ncbi:Bcr/CflA family drug resistance efflux transporter [Alphaproteobacteria bacterium]|nr:Bcr/CflA family drug resistance efflux transporter [Alphaproteobacteria bacterium]